MQFTRLPLAVLTVSSAFILIATSCKKSSSDNNSGLSATIGSANYNPTATLAFDAYGYVNIEGIKISSGDSLDLTVSIPDTATRTMLTFNDGQIEYDDTKVGFDYGTWVYPSHGTVTISSWDKTGKKIAGKFSGVMYNDRATGDSVNISGQFNTTYQ